VPAGDKLVLMNRRDWIKQALVLPPIALAAANSTGLGNSHVQIQVQGTSDSLWSLTAGSRTVAIEPPSIMVDGKLQTAVLKSPVPTNPPQDLGNGIQEQRFSGPFVDDPSLSLELVFRLAHDSPVVRFRYILHASGDAKLTGDGAQLRCLQVSFAGMTRSMELQLSNFNAMLHSYTIAELAIPMRAFEDEAQLVGPIVVGSDDQGRTFLLAYEHGAQEPDCFLEFNLKPGGLVALRAKKMNYLPGQPADGFSTVWMQAAGCEGGFDQLAAQYRRFILDGFSLSSETRRPYIFYNTWNFQERNKWFHGQPYLASMNQQRMLSEIDGAHRMGIDVFVMDTGWYEKTGDWQVSRARFPDQLTGIKQRLDSHGMKLGLWFNPTAAAKSSAMFAANRQCVRTVNGVEGAPHPIWETEESYPMCLVSPYSDAFADTLIRVAKETGARYFKWDAIAQYGCDSPHHWHGDDRNTQADRWNSYAFQLPQQMARVAEKVSAAVGDVIIDFDITEAGRAVGLSFLSGGKYFLINNGPYLFNYDIPFERQKQNSNLFFYPGPARTWICRSPLTYDKWIPSVLFLTHYFPDDPESSQMVNVASLILGQNGIWGDLSAVSPEGVERIGGILRRYKQVRDDITVSDPLVIGAVGSSPEIHEKISAKTGKGAVVLFATTKGSFRYVTSHQPHKSFWTAGEISVQYDPKGHAILGANFSAPGAAIVFFGDYEQA
jgi:alpha-galactosidase